LQPLFEISLEGENGNLDLSWIYSQKILNQQHRLLGKYIMVR